MELRQIYDNLRVGEPISDRELDYAIDKFSQLRHLLIALGPIFHLPAVEATQRLLQLESFKEARKRF